MDGTGHCDTPVCLLCGQAPVEGGGGNLAAQESQKTMSEDKMAQGSDVLWESVTSSHKTKKQHPRNSFLEELDSS